MFLAGILLTSSGRTGGLTPGALESELCCREEGRDKAWWQIHPLSIGSEECLPSLLTYTELHHCHWRMYTMTTTGCALSSAQEWCKRRKYHSLRVSVHTISHSHRCVSQRHLAIPPLSLSWIWSGAWWSSEDPNYFHIWFTLVRRGLFSTLIGLFCL